LTEVPAGKKLNQPRHVHNVRLLAFLMSALALTCLVLRFALCCIGCVFAMLAAITLSRINKAFAASMAALDEMLGR